MLRAIIIYSFLVIFILLDSSPSRAYCSRFDRAYPLTIRNDRGGSVVEYHFKILCLRDHHRQIRLVGRCDSACTLYLTLPEDQLCISKRVKFGFHKPYIKKNNSTKKYSSETAQEYMMGSYPAWVKAWIYNNGGLTNSLKTMKYNYAHRFIKTCD